METYAVYLWPRGSLASDLGSDTLFGAVCWAIQVLGLADVGPLLEEWEERPAFAFSSAFPVARARAGEGERVIRFYPCPPLLEPTPSQIEKWTQGKPNVRAARVRAVEQAKQFKEASWLSEELFARMVRGELDATGLFYALCSEGRDNRNIQQIGHFLLTSDEYRSIQQAGIPVPFIQEQAVQHNQVDRVAGATAEGLLFFEQERFFWRHTGLWCALRAEPEVVDRWIQPAFRYLSDTGLGANRTCGKGHFRIEIGEKLTLPSADVPNSFMVLSRYLPRPGEWEPEAQPLRYTVLNLWPKREQKFPQPVPGHRTPLVYKRRIRMFAPGSLFPLSQVQELYGRLARVVSPESGGHTVWQSGLAIPVFTSWKEAQDEISDLYLDAG